MLKTKELAYQFILEEIEVASQGNEMEISLALNSGISSSEYRGAKSEDPSEPDGKYLAQNLLLTIASDLRSDTFLMVKMRIKIVDNVMKIFHFGKYASNDFFK